MSEFSFPKLLAFLEDEKDQVEFMKVAAEVGLGSSDVELAKLLLALQLYKAFYASIPRTMKSVHSAALAEMRDLRDEMKSLAEQTTRNAMNIGEWAERIQHALSAIQPKEVAVILHKRLLEETMSGISGSVQALNAAYGRIDKSTARLNEASRCAEAGIYEWHTITLRRVWFSAFLISGFAVTTINMAVWLLFPRH